MALSQLKSKERKTDRILVLKPKEGVKTLSTTGVVDSRLFTGENTLHAVKDPARNLWKFRYDAGSVPEPLKGQFTGFDRAYDVAKVYFNKRNVDIIKVID